jgi:hypothetical protein
MSRTGCARVRASTIAARVLTSLCSCVLIALASCADDDLCTLDARPGIRVRVLRRSDRTSLCDADVVIHDGAFEERLYALGTGSCAYSGAVERSGVYRIDIRRAGYVPAVVDGVLVTTDEDNCHVVLAEVSVTLDTNP